MAFSLYLIGTDNAALQPLAETMRTQLPVANEPALFTDEEQLASCLDTAREEADGDPVPLGVLVADLGEGAKAAATALRRLRSLGKRYPGLLLVATSGQGSVELAADSVKAGAADLIVRGPRLEERVQTLWGKLERLLALQEENQYLAARARALAREARGQWQIVGESPAMRRMLDRVERVAIVPRPVLVLGERGTGKELVAHAIHLATKMPEDRLLCVNCAAMPENLLESELFGHERGAFTGADRLVMGKFELANNGTLFLDEIANTSIGFQQKILRVVEYGGYQRVGGTRQMRTNARLIAATNADMAGRIREGRFLQDLYDRLSFEVIRVPPLRERGMDIVLLARYFLERFRREVTSIEAQDFEPTALDALSRYRFPGNVRELKNIVERAAYRNAGPSITAAQLELVPDVGSGAGGTNSPCLEGGFHELVEQYQRRLIGDALDACNGNQAAAARRLGLEYHQFRYFREKLMPDADQ